MNDARRSISAVQGGLCQKYRHLHFPEAVSPAGASYAGGLGGTLSQLSSRSEWAGSPPIARIGKQLRVLSSSPERALRLPEGESINALAQAALSIVLMVSGGMPDFSATARSCSSITARA